MIEKIGLIIFGAFLAKVIDFYLAKRRLNNLENSLIEELEDIKDRLLLIDRAYERCIQIFALGGISRDIPMKLSNPMFKKHYSEIAPKLGSSQRKSFLLIDSYVDTVSRGIDTLRKNHPITPENSQPDTLNTWGELLKGQYSNVAKASWHVKYHLSNRDHPFVDEEDATVKESYINQLKSTEEHIQKLIKDAKNNLSRNDFK